MLRLAVNDVMITIPQWATAALFELWCVRTFRVAFLYFLDKKVYPPSADISIEQILSLTAIVREQLLYSLG
jgi:hypothetical protein